MDATRAWTRDIDARGLGDDAAAARTIAIGRAR